MSTQYYSASAFTRFKESFEKAKQELGKDTSFKTLKEFWMAGAYAEAKEISHNTVSVEPSEFIKDIEFCELFTNPSEIAFNLGYIRQAGFDDILPLIAESRAEKMSHRLFEKHVKPTCNSKYRAHVSMTKGFKVEKIGKFGIKVYNFRNEKFRVIFSSVPLISDIPILYQRYSTMFEEKCTEVDNLLRQVIDESILEDDTSSKEFMYNKDFSILYVSPEGRFKNMPMSDALERAIYA